MLLKDINDSKKQKTTHYFLVNVGTLGEFIMNFHHFLKINFNSRNSFLFVNMSVSNLGTLQHVFTTTAVSMFAEVLRSRTEFLFAMHFVKII